MIIEDTNKETIMITTTSGNRHVVISNKTKMISTMNLIKIKKAISKLTVVILNIIEDLFSKESNNSK